MNGTLKKYRPFHWYGFYILRHALLVKTISTFPCLLLSMNLVVYCTIWHRLLRTFCYKSTINLFSTWNASFTNRRLDPVKDWQECCHKEPIINITTILRIYKSTQSRWNRHNFCYINVTKIQIIDKFLSATICVRMIGI